MSSGTATLAVTITYFGHSCLLVEVNNKSGTAARILLDPGNLTPPLDAVLDLDAVLVTHCHPDHLDPMQMGRLQADGGGVKVFGPAGLKEQLRETNVATTTVEPGAFEVGGVPIVVTRTPHETLYPGVPLPENLVYEIGGRVFAPGDSLTVPTHPVDVLLAPLAGPWMKLAEGIDFVRAVAPTTVIPVHDAGLAPAHRSLHRALFTSFAPEAVVIKPLDSGESFTL